MRREETHWEVSGGGGLVSDSAFLAFAVLKHSE